MLSHLKPLIAFLYLQLLSELVLFPAQQLFPLILVSCRPNVFFFFESRFYVISVSVFLSDVGGGTLKSFDLTLKLINFLFLQLPSTVCLVFDFPLLHSYASSLLRRLQFHVSGWAIQAAGKEIVQYCSSITIFWRQNLSQRTKCQSPWTYRNSFVMKWRTTQYVLF
jgi:hypothetical protein